MRRLEDCQTRLTNAQAALIDGSGSRDKGRGDEMTDLLKEACFRYYCRWLMSHDMEDDEDDSAFLGLYLYLR